MKYIIFLTILLLLVLVACKDSKPTEVALKENKEKSKADLILAKALAAHGGDTYQTAHYEFVFRDRRYEFENDGSNYTYSRTTIKNDSTIIDQLKNGDLTRTINGEEVSLSDKNRDAYSESVNSVIYFVTLPHKLLDPAVNLSFVKEQQIKGQIYEVLKITFDEENGGQDFDDQYHYWINKKDHTIDYLAYNYTVNGGGVRFRSAYNDRRIDNILFQDYINYKAPIGTPLIDLPKLLETDALKELSRIETENVKSMK